MNDAPLSPEEKLKILAQAILDLNSKFIWPAKRQSTADQYGLQNYKQIWEIANDTSVKVFEEMGK